MATSPLDGAALAQLFTDARTHYGWDATPVAGADLRQLYDLVKMGPTSANGSPARFIFCHSVEAREKLAACVSVANQPKVKAAPVTVIIGFDPKFYDKLPELFPHVDARPWFNWSAEFARETAFRNSSLQGAYLIMAARGLGWDTGPMSGFDKMAVDAAFWGETGIETNFICSLGKGNGEGLFPRLPRLSFEDAAQIL
ncbi:malonic semialdehyde reductase [Sandarakinorhabdus limnophila]|uniref:malonic semialdehyde reductase n=1 Tax=Sandarakinorhabdus limnophila TaxID=210512 RepID=UPI0026ED0D6E|nr:malonic semialdehyde reductase [Sandarakinorhabdus limnophila]MCM0031508.1 malonic semialdehyde reductase [Sandarakinorhabdus limnophila]